MTDILAALNQAAAALAVIGNDALAPDHVRDFAKGAFAPARAAARAAETLAGEIEIVMREHIGAEILDGERDAHGNPVAVPTGTEEATHAVIDFLARSQGNPAQMRAALERVLEYARRFADEGDEPAEGDCRASIALAEAALAGTPAPAQGNPTMLAALKGARDYIREVFTDEDFSPDVIEAIEDAIDAAPSQGNRDADVRRDAVASTLKSLLKANELQAESSRGLIKKLGAALDIMGFGPMSALPEPGIRGESPSGVIVDEVEAMEKAAGPRWMASYRMKGVGDATVIYDGDDFDAARDALSGEIERTGNTDGGDDEQAEEMSIQVDRLDIAEINVGAVLDFNVGMIIHRLVRVS